MEEIEISTEVKENREELLSLLENKVSLKQDIVKDLRDTFAHLRTVVTEEVAFFKSRLSDERIRMSIEDRDGTEIKAFVGSDCLIFHQHNNVFLLPETNPLWKEDYLKEDFTRGYFGIIYIYNFLAESMIKQRLGDSGYLIARIFVNKDGHFFVEGKNEIAKRFKPLSEGKICDEMMRFIIQSAFAYAINFDLLTPPYEMVAQINVQQAIAIANSISLQTGKRLGYKFEKD
ncbi:MAG TPA: hypothetical protein PLP27_07835 [Crocinitomicaceae bacterium]|nr:hypothetical protein [Crocinitomicaceae bacterium]